MKKKRVILIALLICIALGILSAKHYEESKVINNTKFTVPQMEEIPEGETKTYVFPDDLVKTSQFSWKNAQEFVDGLKEENSDNSRFETVEVLANGQVAMTVTQGQREIWLRKIEEAINDCIEICQKGGIEVEIEDDITMINFIQKKGFTMTNLTFLSKYAVLLTTTYQIQMFMGIKAEDCYVYTRLERESTGEVLFDERKNGKGWELMEDEWNPEEK
ncbi:MAG: hypothetical protein PHX08_13915 [Lachnospiraceae bacterium]|nr:hypothetical protein [Lachnospiraceae bacterium]